MIGAAASGVRRRHVGTFDFQWRPACGGGIIHRLPSRARSEYPLADNIDRRQGSTDLFTIRDPGTVACGRRAFLRVGTLGLGGLSLAHLLEARAAAGRAAALTDRAVIFLFQHGGPSQFETFDPKMR